MSDLPVEVQAIFQILNLSSSEQATLEQELDETIRVGVFSTMLTQLPKNERERLRATLTGKSEVVQQQLLQETLAKRFSEKKRQEILQQVVMDIVPKFLDVTLTSATAEQRDKVRQAVKKMVETAK